MDHEIIVVDNNSKDGTTDMIRTEFPEILLVEPGANTGYARGNNLALQRASEQSRWLLTLNPDTELTPGAIDRALEVMAERPEVGVLSAQLIGTDGKVQPSVRGFPTLLGILGDLTNLGAFWPQSKMGSYRLPDFDYGVPQFAPQPMGTFLLFRREALESVGDWRRPFDESFPIFFNEVDLLYRLNLAGFATWFEPSVKVRHVGGVSTRQVKKAMIWESHRSLLRYLQKHRQVASWMMPMVRGVVLTGAWIRARGWSEGFRPEHSDL